MFKVRIRTDCSRRAKAAAQLLIGAGAELTAEAQPLVAKQAPGAALEVKAGRAGDEVAPELYFGCGVLEQQLAQPEQAAVDLRIHLRLEQNPEALAKARA